jgi:uncharacterized protein YutE (UPF0331/DUF86 family)
MTPALIRSSVVAERLAWVRRMVSQMRDLPLDTLDTFLEDSRNVGAAESYLRRGIEALLDLGRHILAKGFAVAASEYKEIGLKLVEQGVLCPEDGQLMRRIAGYRNRMVHFYNEVSSKELYLLSTHHVDDIEHLCDVITAWLRQHPEKMDQTV